MGLSVHVWYSIEFIRRALSVTFLLFLGQANLEWNLKATSIFKVAENSFKNFPRLSIFGYKQPSCCYNYGTKKTSQSLVDMFYNCGATIGYHSIGMTC